MKLALVHDYLTQRGGAERVVLSMLRTFPGTTLYTSLYDPEGTFPEFRGVAIRTSPLNRIAQLRRSHRLALPLLAPVFSRFDVDADVAICSSSGWAHGAHVSGRKLVYCYAPARWLYQGDRYLAPRSPVRPVLRALRRPLVRWDRKAAASASRYIVMTRAIAEQVRELYGIEPDVLPPPHNADPNGPREPLGFDLHSGFLVCVARLLPYKNVGAVVDAFRGLPAHQLLVIGDGPEGTALRAMAPSNVVFASRVTDEQLRWVYANCVATISASFEDFGLVPLEAAAFGRPTAALRFGGFLDTIDEGVTGVFFERPEPGEIRAAVRNLLEQSWCADALRHRAAAYSEASFSRRLRETVRATFPD